MRFQNAVLCAASGLAAAKQAPHIAYFLVDDFGWNDIGLRNGTDVLTPQMDALAEDGVILDRFYTQQVCSPSRAAIMTGKFAYRLGLSHGFIAAGAPYGLPLKERTLAQELSAIGYSTHLVGKVSAEGPNSTSHRPQSHTLLFV
jgi:arylsulfatase A-like enzyme